jgi:hypothetical protein
MDIVGDELVVSYAPPDSMYLPEGTKDQRIETRFRLLGDPSAAQNGITNHVVEALYA